MLIDRLLDFFDQNSRRFKKKWTFTLEAGQGETYSSGKPTLYAHSTYERSSVLAGQPQRVFVEQWNDADAARTEITEAKKLYPRFRVEWMLEGGTTHIPIDRMVSHLPDDTDY